MILVDTSVWIDHFRRGIPAFGDLLEAGGVQTHDGVIGELAIGSLAKRDQVLTDLLSLPRAPVASHDELLALIDHERLWGKGLGWVDVHLMASARLSSVPLWTFDRRLAAQASSAGLSVISSRGGP